MSKWSLEDRFLALTTHWVTLVGERYTDHRGQRLEYYRAERADSVIVLPVHGDGLLTAPPSFRPGTGETTLDFPGGRIGERPLDEAARDVLLQELNLPATMLRGLEPMTRHGWPVDSSFSDQRLFGMIAELRLDPLPAEATCERFPLTPQGKEDLLLKMDCAQCRLVLFHHLLEMDMPIGSTPGSSSS